MSVLDWSQCPTVESIPGKVSGAWLFRGTRLPVQVVIDNLASGASIDEVMEWFSISREEIVSALEFVSRSLDESPNMPVRVTEMADAHSF